MSRGEQTGWNPARTLSEEQQEAWTSDRIRRSKERAARRIRTRNILAGAALSASVVLMMVRILG